MKTLLIAVLFLALLAAACATRPGKRELVFHLLDSPSGSFSKADLDAAESLARTATFHNRYLWTDVEQDGQIIYTGAFAHWLPRGQQLDKQLPSATDLANVLQAAKTASAH